MSADQPILTSYRSGGTVAMATVVAIAASIGLVSAVVQGTNDAGLTVPLVCLAMLAVSYVVGLRPVVYETATGLEVRNPLRTTTISWESITDVAITDVLVIEAGDARVRCFSVPRRGRPRVAHDPATGTVAFVGGPGPIVGRVLDTADNFRRKDRVPVPPTVVWARDGVGAVVLASVSLLGAVVSAVLT